MCGWMDGTGRSHQSKVIPGPVEAGELMMSLEEARLVEAETSPAAAACGHTFGFNLLLEDATGQV